MRILIIEDDTALCGAVKFHLEQEGYIVDTCLNGEDGLHFIKQEAYDLILLDRLLPELDGMDVLSRTRALGITSQVIMITALDGIGDRIAGLDTGADDYIVKPFDINELLARVRAVSRRPRQWKSTEVIVLDNTELDLLRCTLKGPSTKCTLSKKESELLEIFMRNRGCIMPRSVLLSRVWGPDAPVEDGNLDNYVHFLRKRLRFVGSRLFIKTARGVGYSMEVKDA
ncbi:response regulator transcription factor [Sedimentibacter sp.]|uniref:response regulator transcription factor n=1 Tax=Sedimentibacter sp. TaxID=1960295 RepID=UPI0028ADF8C8|nr:response regulator transcription factor [Sedimentibacter sp.]